MNNLEGVPMFVARSLSKHEVELRDTESGSTWRIADDSTPYLGSFSIPMLSRAAIVLALGECIVAFGTGLVAILILALVMVGVWVALRILRRRREKMRRLLITGRLVSLQDYALAFHNRDFHPEVREEIISHLNNVRADDAWYIATRSIGHEFDTVIFDRARAIVPDADRYVIERALEFSLDHDGPEGREVRRMVRLIVRDAEQFDFEIMWARREERSEQKAVEFETEREEMIAEILHDIREELADAGEQL